MATLFSGGNHLITGGDFTIVQGSQYMGSHPERGLEVLSKNVAGGAFHNAAERYDAPKCHENTRVAILQEIMEWIKDLDTKELFRWLYGPAGAGKSAIAQAIAELCHETNLIAASFFFSRVVADRNNTSRLIPTIAYQLTITIPEILQHVSSAIERDPLIFTRSLKAQLEVLILQPLNSFIRSDASRGKLHPRLIVIDGLDECGDGETQYYFLTTLSSSIQRYPVPLIFLIASRPEQAIRNAFNQHPLNSLTGRIVLDDKYQPDADIRLFLTSQFEEIKKCHPSAPYIASSWPSTTQIEELVNRSSGQFIYASTVIKFVQSSRHLPKKRLDIILGLIAPGKETPFTKLDTLYTLIFETVAPEHVEAVLDIFSFLLLFSGTSTDKAKPDTVSGFWCYESGELQTILTDLHSVIYVPSPYSSEQPQLRILHASLQDFLLDKSRSGRFFIDAPKVHARMAQYCIRHTSMALDSLRSGHAEIISGYLQMSCESFLTECSKAYPSKELLQELDSIKFNEFLTFTTQYRGDVVESLWRTIAIDFPTFLDWLQKQCSPSHIPGCLCRRYMTYLDNYLHDQLPHYALPTHQLQYLLISLTAGSNFRECREFWNDINSFNDLFTNVIYSIDYSRIRLISTMNDHKYQKYRSILTQFFMDPGRSGIYYLDKSKHMEVMLKTLQYMHRENGFKEGGKRIILRIMERFPVDPDFANHLRAKSLSINPSFDAAVKAYIEAFDLGTCTTAASVPQPLESSPHQ